MKKLLPAEWIKLRRSIIWLLLPISPILAALSGWSPLDIGKDPLQTWLEALAVGATVHGLFFLPLLTGICAALICRYEHAAGGWKQLAALPVRRSSVYLAKMMVLAALLALLQLLYGAAILVGGMLKGAPIDAIPWEMISMLVGYGWLASLPLAALQLWVSTAWQSFAAPLAVNVVFTLPNMLVTNSEDIAPWYPWAQPLLAMMPQDRYDVGAFTVSLETLFIVVAGSFVVFLGAGWTSFLRRAV
ncbi:hypothetical protein SAMN05444162_1902 [Paenibacillaceae bacterium GAS479]|nr:hypothetical protein SAMN05444162_1902 [Paenibacillaceae bacterium GAS479]